MGKHFGLSGSTIVAGIGKALCGLILGLIVCTDDVGAATYFISPTGTDSNSGVPTTSPWLTFSKAISMMDCGDTLTLQNGVYGDGTNTGTLNISSKSCTASTPMTFRALNQRQARIHDDGSGVAIRISNSAYIVFDGIVASSRDNASFTGSGQGTVVHVTESNHITVKNSLLRNPNRYGNNNVLYFISNTTDSLVEDTEVYNYHRHCLNFTGQRLTARRVYCNPRTGKISGGYGSPVGTGDAGVSMYPCTDCIQENVIVDGSSAKGYLNEMNATGSLLMSGSKIFGSICYTCRGNGIYLNARNAVGPAYSPRNITITNIVIYNHTEASALKNYDGVNVVMDHITLTGNGAVNGLDNGNGPFGATSTSFTATNMIAKGFSSAGFTVSGVTSWSGNKLHSNGNGTAFSPASSWTNTSTSDPGLGTCIAWIPDGAAVKGAGTGGTDIGANVLYRYVNGVLTTKPLWDPTTGEFPHGAIVPGVNDVPGHSVFDVHKRLNVNTNGCSFPANYGDGVTDGDAPGAPVGLRLF